MPAGSAARLLFHERVVCVDYSSPSYHSFSSTRALISIKWSSGHDLRPSIQSLASKLTTHMSLIVINRKPNASSLASKQLRRHALMHSLRCTGTSSKIHVSSRTLLDLEIWCRSRLNRVEVAGWVESEVVFMSAVRLRDDVASYERTLQQTHNPVRRCPSVHGTKFLAPSHIVQIENEVC
jgi:hypothetical protein